MVSASEGLIYYCTVFLTALVFLTEASAITTNYEKSNSQNKTHEIPTLSSQRTKSTPTRNRANLSSKHQNHDRVNPILLSKPKSNTKNDIGPPPRTNLQIDEILSPSNSGGENETKDKGGNGVSTTDDDDQKTLLQQVADGKYGLIQNEIFADKPKRLGVINYDANPEVPKDNVNNLGGLDSEDIWLAENHLLVLAGSRLYDNQWVPIDNYVAPKRPVKIPPNPKVPPPFPVQLSENGPIEYVGLKRPEQPAGVFNPFHLPFANFNTSSPDNIFASYGKQPYGSPGNPQTARLPIKSSFLSNPKIPPSLPASLPKPPPGAEFIPPYLRVINQSEILDEDDPSLYYPPPYDFYYPKDNTSKVPAGPLVPGIVMPPPPNFFSSFENSTVNSGKSKYALQPTLTKDKPYKGHAHKIGKQLQYVNNSKAIIHSTPTTSTDASPPSWRPNDFLSYNEIPNDQTYPANDENVAPPSVKEEEAKDQVDWIPIPAPTPLYITGPKKPIKNTVLLTTETLKSPGYSYNRPENAFSLPEKQHEINFLQHSNEQNGFPSTTPFIYSQIMSTQSPPLQNGISSTTPLTPAKQSPTIKATYYFYEEPKFVGLDEPQSTYPNTDSPPTTISPLTQQHEHLPKIRYKFDDKKRGPNAPFIPIYYLAELDNVVDFVKPASIPESTHVSKNEYYTTTAKPTYTINKPHYEQPTPKSISEYSYVASNYNNPASSIVDSTLGPLQPSNFNTAPAAPNYQFDYNNFYGQQQQQPQQQHQQQPHLSARFPSMQSHYSVFQVPVHTTATPILFLDQINQYTPPKVPEYNFERPWIQNLNIYGNDGYAVYPTENPYYAFFTKEDADLIDENTKKYFTIFGQKIKHGIESTSPIPVVQTIAAPEIGDSRWNAKHRMYKKYPSQSSKNAYSVYSTTAVPYKTLTSTDQSESQILRTAINKPLHPLVSHNRANDVTPLPLSNTNSEYLTSKLLKHIRPIVVQDLPADLNERLKNIINSPDRDAKFLDDRPSNSRPRFRYTLIDNIAYDNQPYRYSQYVLNKYRNNNYPMPLYSEHRSPTQVSLHDDIRVNNYRRGQKQTEDPDAEYIHNSSENVGTVRKGNGDDSNDEAEETNTPKVISLEKDVLVNYKKPHPKNPDAEYINTDGHEARSASRTRVYSNRDDGYSDTSYSSPNAERDRLYFLTSPETHLTQIEDERYYSQSNVEKPSTYTKRVIEKTKERASRSAKTPCDSASCSS